MTVEMSAEEMVREALRENVIDPEIGVNIVDLGLVYEIEMLDGGVAEVTMTLTTPACPLGPYIDQEVRTAVDGVPGVSGAKVNLVWQPPWDPRTMASDSPAAASFHWSLLRARCPCSDPCCPEEDGLPAAAAAGGT